MKKTMTALLLGALILVGTAVSSWAEFVYVTKHGKKYHHAESRFIQNKETEKLTIEEAEDRGYEPSRAYLNFQKAQQDNAEEK